MECTQTKPREFDRGATDRRRWRLSTRYLEEEEVEVVVEEEEEEVFGRRHFRNDAARRWRAIFSLTVG